MRRQAQSRLYRTDHYRVRVRVGGQVQEESRPDITQGQGDRNVVVAGRVYIHTYNRHTKQNIIKGTECDNKDN